MRNKDTAYCWDSLEGMSTEQLDDLLQEELHRPQPDGESVRLILKVLEERDSAEDTELGSEIEKAWKKYQKRTEKTAVAPTRWHGLLLRVASIVLVIGLIALVIPQHAHAGGLFDRVALWTDSFFQLLGFGDDEISEEYVFQTENPGLQQVYDAVVDLGVTEPVVPMWLPEGYSLSSLDVDSGRENTLLTSSFFADQRCAVVLVSIYLDDTQSKYYKNESSYFTYEINGTVHNVMHNDDVWVAVWMNDNIECSISIECQENELYKILKSIYSVEVE